MAGEADRLEQAAWALTEAAHRLDDSIRRLCIRVEAEVVQSSRGWKGPAADRFWWATQDRANRMRRTRDRMQALAEQMRREATVVRQEEERRRSAQQGR
jgi:uncharacterized protein YukE